MTDIQKLERLAYLANLPYTSHTSEDWEEELRLECEIQQDLEKQYPNAPDNVIQYALIKLKEKNL